MDEYTIIHGDKWKWVDIQESVEEANKKEWKRKKWSTRPALVSKGRISDYTGQRYNPKYTKLVDDGWTHDHCAICWWSLHESEDPETGIGYTTDDHEWLCTECFEKFIKQKL